MSKKMARKISEQTGSTLFEALEFLRAEMRSHEARMEHQPHRREQTRQCLQEARSAWKKGIPLSIPNVGFKYRYIVPKNFFVSSWYGKRATLSASQQRDDHRRWCEKIGLESPDVFFEVTETN